MNIVLQAVQWWGHIKIILTSDNERTILACITRAMITIRCQVENLETVTSEQSAKYDSQSNGATEVGIKIVRGQFRTMRICVEGRICRAIPSQHALTSWLIEHVGFLHSACIRGDDGHSGWSRVRGRPFGQRVIGFGVQVLWQPPQTGPQHDVAGNMAPRFLEVSFLG